MRWSAGWRGRSSHGSSDGGWPCGPRGWSRSTSRSRRATTPSTRRSRSSRSSSRSSPRERRWRSCSRASRPSPSCGRRWARPTRPTRRPGRSAATSRWRCPTTWCTGRTRRRRRSGRSSSGSRMSRPDDYVAQNIQVWTEDDGYLVESGRRAWGAAEPYWGIWHVPESEVGVLPEVAGKDVVELGCGTAYWSAWFARRGAKVVAVDPTPAQLERASRFQQEFGLDFPLVEAAAENVPLESEAFDLAFSEY